MLRPAGERFTLQQWRNTFVIIQHFIELSFGLLNIQEANVANQGKHEVPCGSYIDRSILLSCTEADTGGYHSRILLRTIYDHHRISETISSSSALQTDY